MIAGCIEVKLGLDALNKLSLEFASLRSTDSEWFNMEPIEHFLKDV
jgi:hypothetical protein